MNGARLWLSLATVHSLLQMSLCAHHHRRSMPTPTTLPLSKGGWRPVLSSALPGYGTFAAAPLHAPVSVPIHTYKIPLDNYQSPSSSRPVARDVTKLTSPQSYRPTTLRSLPSSPTIPSNQPINSYYHPYNLPNGLSHYKIIQNFPIENVVIRNPHNPYAARPVMKYPSKYKQSNAMYQQLNNVQQLQFPVQGYPTGKPSEGFGKFSDNGKRPQSTSGTEVFKPDVYKLSDSDTAPQQVSQQVKTAQQQQNTAHQQQNTANQQQNTAHQQQNTAHNQQKTAQQQQNTAHHQQNTAQYQQNTAQFQQNTAQLQQNTAQYQQNSAQKAAYNSFPHFTFKDDKFSQAQQNLLGNAFNSFGVQSVKARDPVYSPTRTTFLPPQSTKHAIFSSFSYGPYFKTTSSQFPNSTPKFQTTLNQINFGSTADSATQPPKTNSVKPDPNPGGKIYFKPSPQDPFAKPITGDNGYKHQAQSYNPTQQPTTASVNSYYYNNFHDQRYPTHHSQNLNYNYNQPSFAYENKKHRIHDSLTSSVNQHTSAQNPDGAKKKPEVEATPNSLPAPSTYEVTENSESDIVTHPTNTWSAIPDYQQKPASEESVLRDQLSENAFGRPATTASIEQPEEYTIVTEPEKGYENSLTYDSHVETQSRRPLDDDFQPIGKHKLKDYYYKVSTPSQDDFSSQKRLKVRPTEAVTSSVASELTTFDSSKNNDVEVLPTLPPNKHFKRPNAQDPMDKDKIRKRNKIRRRRPVQGHQNKTKEESSTRRYTTPTSDSSQTTESEETYTVKPRVRVTKPKLQFTTPTITTDLSTSALPTLSPTSPTITKKKVRRPTTTSDQYEVTTFSYRNTESEKESPIMKIATRPQNSRTTTPTYDYNKFNERPDYSHKQDEKDTPTSDISIITDTIRRSPDQNKQFSFHKDVKPLEAKVEPVRTTVTEDSSDLTTTTSRSENSSENSGKSRPRTKSKYEGNRPKFSVKEYRNRLSSTTTSTTEKSLEAVVPKFRFPQRRLPFESKSNDSEPEKKKFTPKDQRHKVSNTSENETSTEKEVHSTRQPTKQRHSSSTENSSTNETTQKISSRIRSSSRRPKPTEEPTEASSPTTVHVKRPIRKKVKDSEIGESVQDVAVTETTMHYEKRDDPVSERTRSESAIMKIAKDDKKHQSDHMDLFEHSKRVSDLTLAASKDYSNPGKFKSVSPNSRRVPSYFTIATDDPILPIEAFFPQLNQKKES